MRFSPVAPSDPPAAPCGACARWKAGQFMFQGGGGNDGVINPAIGSNTGALAATAGTSAFALSRGFAVVSSTDGGHQGTDAASFGKDSRARVDHA